MLIKFTVKNLLSFKEIASLDFEAGSIREFPQNVSTELKGTVEIKLLKNVTLFGANSSGKTNFLKAFSVMRYWLLNGLRDSAEGKKVPLSPFLLNVSTENAPSSFEVHFIVNNNGYRYGFLADKEKIHEEWLFVTTKRKEENIFIRAAGEYNIDRRFQSDLKQKLKVLIEFTKPQVLFLSVMAQFNVEFAQNILDWFVRHRIFINNELDNNTNITASLLKNDRYRPTIYDIIKKSDLGFSTIKEELEEAVKKPLKYLEAYYAMNEEELSSYSIKTRHKKFKENFDFKENVYFDLNENESAGAKKFIALLGPIVRALEDGEIIWIDELDSRLHTFLVSLLIQMINSTRYNQHGCQAIITTHNIQVFKKLRRDQMFLLNKDDYGISYMASIYKGQPLVRGDAIIDKEYLGNRLGGVPKVNKQLFLDFDQDIQDNL